jgi:hypothetical protein
LEREAGKVGLKINEQETKYMILARNDRTICDVGHSVAIGDKHFEVVKEFLYLGPLMTPTNDVSLEIQRRTHTAKTSAVEPPFTPDKKNTIHKTLIRPSKMVYRRRYNHELD